MIYLFKRDGRYYYNRRIPEVFTHLDPRGAIRISLKTDSKHIAMRKAIMYNEQIEAYWSELAAKNRPHDDKDFRKAVAIARRLGFSYQPMSAVVSLPIEDLIERVLATRDATPRQVEVVLGARQKPELMLSQLPEQYWPVSKRRILHKTPDQLRKWKNPRLKAVANLVKICGDKPIYKLVRDDILRLQTWWIDRIENDNKNAGSANKDFIHLKSMLKAVCEHHTIDLNIAHLLNGILLETRFKQTRLPLSREQIIGILESPKLQKMQSELRWFLLAAAETGARPSELVGLMPEDIKLNADVPHIAITDRKDRQLKTPHSQREIPLVGFALRAFEALPEGFEKYRGKPDNLTNAVNKFLRDNELLPSKQHSVYSLRHSFQDRLTAAGVPDRIQCELMGHKFHRPKYGVGASIEQKQVVMRKCSILSNFQY